MPIYNINGKRILFIHIPKTGGSSVEFVLRKYSHESFYNPAIPDFLKCSPQHLTLSDHQLLFRKLEFDFIFTIVRNPYERIKSEYGYRTELTKERYGKRPEFTNWVKVNFEKAKKNKFHLDNHIREQVDFLGEDLTIYKFEIGFDKIFDKLFKIIGIKNTEIIPRKNQSVEEKHELRKQDTRLINSFYKDDFETLNYEKQSPNFY